MIEAGVKDVWTRLRQKVAVNDAYYHFIDTGKLMPLVEASLASPEDSSLLKRAIEMLENYRGYPWVIKRQVAKVRKAKVHSRPKEPEAMRDIRLTYMQVAIEKHEWMLNWAGEQRITASKVIHRIWELEDLPPLKLSGLGQSARYALHKQAKSHVPKDLWWRNYFEIQVCEGDPEFMRLWTEFGHKSSK